MPRRDCAVQRSLECKVEWYEGQVKREVASKEAEAAKHAQQQEQLQASRDTLQKHLAVTEAEFRLALQVSIDPPCSIQGTVSTVIVIHVFISVLLCSCTVCKVSALT